VIQDTAELLERERAAIVAAAGAALARAHARHYDSAGLEETTRRLDALYDRLLAALGSHDLGAVIGHAEEVAEERFEAGFDLSEVQTAFNVLEEAIWTRALAVVEPARLAETLGLVTTVLGAGKDALARRYVSLAAGAHTPSLDLRALFGGAAAGDAERPVGA
jgi:hypothetical protein